MTSFQLSGIPYEPFAPLFALSDQQLRDIDAGRVIADSNRGYPCRVSLTDAAIGEELLLLPYEHQPAPSPYRSSGPIFVRKHAVQRTLDPDVVPDYVRSRLMSVRAYDAAHQMTDAVVCAGQEAAGVIQRMFASAGVEYIHLHNASRGCFSCAVHRARPESGESDDQHRG